MKILVTGGAGYIGSHALVSLSRAGYEPVVVDNYSNSSPKSLDRIKTIIGKEIINYECDINDKEKLSKIFGEHKFDAVMHFAGLKAVGESVQFPLKYYNNNVSGSVTLFELMDVFDVRKLIFSSSATVYGDPEEVPINETARLSATNPYGRTKLMIEDICRDLIKSETSDKGINWQISLLRYFNPIGAHESGLIGEDPNGIPNNLMPYLLKVAVGELNELQVFGDDYPTPDGTGKRDYIHVMDLVKGHVAALNWLLAKDQSNSICREFNLGTGRSVSVLELIKNFTELTGVNIKYSIVDRRPGDIAECYADPTLSNVELNWKSHYTLKDMIMDGWKWQKNNPKGYEG
ncbi:UDP-glucose 4-epimerase GalE [bacterium]|nr:UDP-glucose 4-epimerase GalE [bacterium]